METPDPQPNALQRILVVVFALMLLGFGMGMLAIASQIVRDGHYVVTWKSRSTFSAGPVGLNASESRGTTHYQGEDAAWLPSYRLRQKGVNPDLSQFRKTVFGPPDRFWVRRPSNRQGGRR